MAEYKQLGLEFMDNSELNNRNLSSDLELKTDLKNFALTAGPLIIAAAAAFIWVYVSAYQ